MLKVLILGYGFIGKHLAVTLARKSNISLTVLGRNEVEKKLSNVAYICGDYRDPQLLREALAGQDIVYHLISHSIPSSSWDSPETEVEKNLLPSLKLIEIAGEANVKKIAFVSSGGTIYGRQQNILTEESAPGPFSPHGIIKRTTESFLEYARIRYGLNYDIYRVSNVYGEGQRVEKGLGFINTVLENLINDRPVNIYGDGENIRDYVYVRDVAELLTASIRKNMADHDIYNVSSNHPISLNDLIDLIKKVTGTDFEVNYRPSRLSDNRKVILSNSKIMRLFPDFTLCSLEEGIKITYDHLRGTSALKKAGSL